MSVLRTFTGTCPEHNKKATVTAEFAEIRMNCSLLPGYKYMRHSCKIVSLNGCSYRKCPLIDQE